MVKRFLNDTTIFKFEFKFLVLHPALLFMQFADSAGNIAAGALIQANTLRYRIFRIYLRLSERFLKVEDCNRHMQTIMLH
jgi:hypothetical protein